MPRIYGRGDEEGGKKEMGPIYIASYPFAHSLEQPHRGCAYRTCTFFTDYKKLDIQVATASEGLGLVGYSTRVAFTVQYSMNCADGGFVGTRIMPEQSEGGLTRRLYSTVKASKASTSSLYDLFSRTTKYRRGQNWWDIPSPSNLTHASRVNRVA